MPHPIRNPERRSIYLKQKSIGWSTGDAKRAADALYVFRKLEDAGLVRVLAIPDDDARTALEYLDQPHITGTREGRAYAKEIRRKADDDGVYGLTTEYRVPYGLEYDPETGEGLGPWTDADSCWGFIGDEADTQIDRTGYLSDLACKCLGQFKVAYRSALANASCSRPRR